MTRLFNDPADFASESLDGFVRAHSRWVRRASGGVVRAGPSAPGNVAVVVGGGSGHYPAFSGLVGRGMAHGAAIGNVFASPSANQVYSVARASSRGGGVLLVFGNYAGDDLHFRQASDRLNGEGIECRAVAVTDDVASAGVDEIHKRRGIAGDVAVIKIAGAAADSGLTLAEVTRIATLANDRTRSFGIAFSGCTLPGAGAPLFEVPKNRMALGLGIHGEPGIGERDIPSADELASLLVDALMADLPPDVTQTRGERIAVILNGLGAVKHEELFVVFRRIAQLLEERELEVVDTEIGELVTSFDMAGASLTLIWLNDDLEEFWTAPADSAAFRRGTVEPDTADSTDSTQEQPVVEAVAAVPPASQASQIAASIALAALEAMQDVVKTNEDRLGQIDSIAGDGDHGIGMTRGTTAAVAAGREALQLGGGVETVLTWAGDAFSDRAGGTSGALWGLGLRALGSALGNEDAPHASQLSKAIEDATKEIMRVGKAVVGDKTMVDVLVPFNETFASSVHQGQSLVEAWRDATDAAEQAAQDTAHLVPRMGRARPHAERSIGTPDAGAVSLALIVRAVGGVLASHRSPTRPQ
jgi:D-erythrulose 4-kinase